MNLPPEARFLARCALADACLLSLAGLVVAAGILLDRRTTHTKEN